MYARLSVTMCFLPHVQVDYWLVIVCLYRNRSGVSLRVIIAIFGLLVTCGCIVIGRHTFTHTDRFSDTLVWFGKQGKQANKQTSISSILFVFQSLFQ